MLPQRGSCNGSRSEDAYMSEIFVGSSTTLASRRRVPKLSLRNSSSIPVASSRRMCSETFRTMLVWMLLATGRAGRLIGQKIVTPFVSGLAHVPVDTYAPSVRRCTSCSPASSNTCGGSAGSWHWRCPTVRACTMTLSSRTLGHKDLRAADGQTETFVR